MFQKRLAVNLDHRLGPDVGQGPHAFAAAARKNHGLRWTTQSLVWLLEVHGIIN
jgi:hypothetical protein